MNGLLLWKSWGANYGTRITQALQKPFEKHRIVFWYDAKQARAEFFRTIKRKDALKRLLKADDSASSRQSEKSKSKARKEIEKTARLIAEMEEYEREVLYPLATEQVEIDLDDGVRVNYPKLGAALKKIPGLDAKED